MSAIDPELKMSTRLGKQKKEHVKSVFFLFLHFFDCYLEGTVDETSLD